MHEDLQKKHSLWNSRVCCCAACAGCAFVELCCLNLIIPLDPILNCVEGNRVLWSEHYFVMPQCFDRRMPIICVRNYMACVIDWFSFFFRKLPSPPVIEINHETISPCSSSSVSPASKSSQDHISASQPCVICSEKGRKLHESNPEKSISCMACASFFVKTLRLLIFKGKLKCDFKGKWKFAFYRTFVTSALMISPVHVIGIQM